MRTNHRLLGCVDLLDVESRSSRLPKEETRARRKASRSTIDISLKFTLPSTSLIMTGGGKEKAGGIGHYLSSDAFSYDRDNLGVP